MKLNVWWQAVTTMPSMTISQWQQLDLVARWLIATRASVLLMTLSSAAIAGILAWGDGAFNAGLFTLTVIGLGFAHATNNLINDLTDSRMGIDKDNYYRNQYGVHILEAKLVSLQEFWRYILFTAAVALIAGCLLTWLRGGLTLPLMVAGVFFVLFYTWPLKYIGLGEPAVLLVWGPLMIGGSYFVITGHWSWPVAWLGMLYALGPTSVLFGKHIDKIDLDAKKGVRSLPVLLGERLARRCVIAMLVLQYVLAVMLIATGDFHWVMAILLLNLPTLWRLIASYRNSKPAQRPADFPENIWPLWFSAYAFDHTRKFTGLFLLGLLAGMFLR